MARAPAWRSPWRWLAGVEDQDVHSGLGTALGELFRLR
jgi:hypothetical protein